MAKTLQIPGSRCRILDAASGEPLFGEARVADRFRTRARGLLGQRGLTLEQALIIERCGSIHTCFMKMRIDVAFYDHGYGLIRVEEAVRPWRFLAERSAAGVIEAAPGAFRVKGIEAGHQIILQYG